jgi:hypothetical protein
MTSSPLFVVVRVPVIHSCGSSPSFNVIQDLADVVARHASGGHPCGGTTTEIVTSKVDLEDARDSGRRLFRAIEE